MRSIQDPAKFIEHLEILMNERDLLDLLARFDDAAIRNDAELFRSLWTEDGEWTISDPVPLKAVGHDALVKALAAFKEQNLFFFRMTGRPVFRLDGDTAYLQSPTVELAGRAGSRGYANVALYEDEVIREQDGQCRFKKRHYQYLWVDTNTQLNGQTVKLPA